MFAEVEYKCPGASPSNDGTRGLVPSNLDSVSGSQLLLYFTGRSFGGVCSLDEFMDSNQRFLQCLKGACVQHFLLDFSRVWAPRHQEQLLLLGAFSGSLKTIFIIHYNINSYTVSM